MSDNSSPAISETGATARADTSSSATGTAAAARSPFQRRTPSKLVTATLGRPLAAGFAITLGGVLAIGLAFTVSNLSSILVSIALALFIALGLDPVIAWLERHGVKRSWGILMVIGATVLVFLGIISIVIPVVTSQIIQFIASVPGIIDEFLGSQLYAWVDQNYGENITQGIEDLTGMLLDPGTLATIGGGVFQVGAGIVGGISSGIIVFVLTLYFTASLRTIKQGFYRLVPAWTRPQVADLTERITDSVGSYIKGMVILAFFNAVFVLIMHLILGLPFAALLAVGAFFITIIPLVGTVAFWVIGSGIALFTDPWLALIFAIAYLVYMQVEAYFLTPRIMNRAISVPGSLVVIGAVVGGTLLGFLGALVAIPVTASILLIIKEVAIPAQDAKTEPPATHHEPVATAAPVSSTEPPSPEAPAAPASPAT